MDIGGLAAPTSNTLKGPTVTDVWETAGYRILLFGFGQPDLVIERRPDATHWQLAIVSPADLRQAQAAMAAKCATRLTGLLRTSWTLRPGCVLRGQTWTLLPAGLVSAKGHSAAVAIAQRY